MEEMESKFEIWVHLLGGKEYAFSVDEDAERRKIMGSIQPNRLFSQKQLMIAGQYFMTALSPAAITRIEIICDRQDVPAWHLPGGIKELVQIQEERLDRRALPRFSDPLRSDAEIEPGADVDTFTEFNMADGKRVCVRMAATVQGSIDQRAQLAQLFGSVGFHVTRLGGGVIFINTAHVVRWAMYPGPADAPPNAWRAHRLDQGEWGGMPSKIFEKMDLSDPSDSEFSSSEVVVGEGSKLRDAEDILFADVEDEDELEAEEFYQDEDDPQPGDSQQINPKPAGEHEAAPIPETQKMDTRETPKPKRRQLKFGKKKE